MSKCREEFEKYIRNKYSFPQEWLERHSESGEYIHGDLQIKWIAWQDGWNASHDRCVEICEEKSGVPREAGTYAFTREEMIKQDACIECKEAINKDKVDI